MEEKKKTIKIKLSIVISQTTVTASSFFIVLFSRPEPKQLMTGAYAFKNNSGNMNIVFKTGKFC